MKKLTAIMLILAFIIISKNAFAFKVGVALPISTSLTDSKINEGVKSVSVSGISIEVEPPLFGIGLSLDQWEYKLELKTAGELTSKQSIFNIYYSLPIPIITAIIGAGIGTSELEHSSPIFTYDSAQAQQVFAKIGYPLLPLFSINLGYHLITVAEHKSKQVNDEALNISNNTITFGAQLGF